MDEKAKPAEPAIVTAAGTAGRSYSGFAKAMEEAMSAVVLEVQRESEEIWPKILEQAPQREDENGKDVTNHEHPLRKRMNEINSVEYIKAQQIEARKRVMKEFEERRRADAEADAAGNDGDA